MCGIAGFYRLHRDGAFPSREALGAMTTALAHRGPDGEGYHYDLSAGIALGHRRLAIIDVEGGRQPISGSDGASQIVLNGEIYNYRELRGELAALGAVFTTHSDTEVLLRGYEVWGLDVLRRLNGIFGVAIWDAGQRRLLLARDPVGVKPLYFEEADGCLSFASEMRGLLVARGSPARMDPAALGRYLAFRYVPSPLTLMSGVRRLPPAHVLICDGTGVRMEPFIRWEPRIRPVSSESEVVGRFSEEFSRAVTRQMVSDVPVGALLSGGLDSASVVYHMRSAANGPVRTFTVGFEDDGDASELPDARATAKRLGTDHVEVVIPPTDFLTSFPQAVAQVEEPISSSSALALHSICREARRYVKVVLSGQGADEPLGGYDRYRAERYARFLRVVPSAVRGGAALPLARRFTRSEKLRRLLESMGEADTARRFVRIYNVFPEGFLPRLVRPEFHAQVFAESPETVIEAHRAPSRGLPSVAQLMYVDTRMWLPDDLLLYGDKMSMASGLELRVPFLDLDLLAFLESIPPQWRVRGLTGKYLLKRAARAWFPREMIRRPQRGFAPPIAAWFRTTLREYARETLLGADARTREWLAPEPIRDLIDLHASGRADYHRAIFSLLSLEVWARLFLTADSAVPAAGGVGER